jgi:hypothetical protein
LFLLQRNDTRKGTCKEILNIIEKDMIRNQNIYPALKLCDKIHKFNYIGVAIITNAIKFVQMD